MAATERGPCTNILSPVEAAAHDKRESEGKLSTQSPVDTDPDDEDQKTLPEDAAIASEANEKKPPKLYSKTISDELETRPTAEPDEEPPHDCNDDL